MLIVISRPMLALNSSRFSAQPDITTFFRIHERVTGENVAICGENADRALCVPRRIECSGIKAIFREIGSSIDKDVRLETLKVSHAHIPVGKRGKSQDDSDKQRAAFLVWFYPIFD